MKASDGDSFGHLANEAERLAESIADLALDLLHEALSGDGASQRSEKELQKARRSVMKAEQILRTLSQAQDD